MRGVRFIKKELERLETVLEQALDLEPDSTARKELSSIVAKLEAAKKPIDKASFTVPMAVRAIREVLGARIVLPPKYPSCGVEWFSPLALRIKQLGLNQDDITEATKAAAQRWKGPIRAESIIRQADKLLTGELPQDSKDFRPEMESY